MDVVFGDYGDDGVFVDDFVVFVDDDDVVGVVVVVDVEVEVVVGDECDEVCECFGCWF